MAPDIHSNTSTKSTLLFPLQLIMQRSSQVISRWATRLLWPSKELSYSAASVVSPGARTSGDVPQGHLGSDLSPNVCNIGLGRRRDLTLRSDLCLYSGDGQKTSLSHILKVIPLPSRGLPSTYLVIPVHITGEESHPSWLPRRAGLHREAHSQLRCHGKLD